MHVIWIHQHFTTNEGNTGTRSYDLIRYLIARGHRVSVICGRFPLGGFGDAVHGLWEHRVVGGVDVYVVNALYAADMSTSARAMSFLRFAALASLLILRLDQADAIYAVSTPPTVSIPAFVDRFVRGKTPFVLELGDLWPEAFQDIGIVRAGWKTRLMKFAADRMYRAADRLVVVSDAYRGELKNYSVPDDKVVFSPLGADPESFPPRDGGPTLREGIIGSDDVVFCYAGAHGALNNLGYVLDAAGMLHDRDDVKFAFIGTGPAKPALVERARREKLPNVVFVDPVAKRELWDLLRSADAGLNIVRDSHQNRITTPNKIYDYMFCGLPIITTAPTDGGGAVQAIVESNGCGVGVKANDPGDLADVARRWADDKTLRQQMSDRGLQLANARFRRATLAEQIEQLLETVRK